MLNGKHGNINIINMKKILINGNMGYIGPVLVNHLRKKYTGIKIIGFDSAFFAGCLIDPNVFPEDKVDVQHFGDVRNFPVNILEGVDAVIQLAAISNDPMGNVFEKATLEINYKSAVTIAKHAKIFGVKNFVFASSCSVYGFADNSPRTEISETNPLTAYAKSKIYTENDLNKIADENFKITCLRFATACGFSDRLRLDLVLNDFVATAISSKKISILSDGSPWRPLIHVKDMARAIDWAAQRKDYDNCLIINAGSNSWNYQVKDLANAVKKVFGNIELDINKNAVPDKRSYKVSFDLFKKLAPNHQPVITLLDAIEDLKDGLEKIRFKDKDFRQSNLIRLQTIKTLIKKKLINENLERLI